MKLRSLFILAIPLCMACATQKKQTALIKDCPEEKIVNKMPMVRVDGQEAKPASYYIYKGERREITEFDEKWLKEHCTIDERAVY